MEKMKEIWERIKDASRVVRAILIIWLITLIVALPFYALVGYCIRNATNDGPKLISADMAGGDGFCLRLNLGDMSDEKPGTILGEFMSRYGNYKITVSVPKIPEELTELLGDKYIMIYHECLTDDFGPTEHELDSNWNETSKAYRAELVFYQTGLAIDVPSGDMPWFIDYDHERIDVDYAFVKMSDDNQQVVKFVNDNFSGCYDECRYILDDELTLGRSSDACIITKYQEDEKSNDYVYSCIRSEQRGDDVIYSQNPKDVMLGSSQCTPTSFTPTAAQINRLKTALADSPLA